MVSHRLQHVGQSDRAPGRVRLAVAVAAALIAALLGFAGSGFAAAQTGQSVSDVTFSGTVTAPSGMSTEDVVVSVVAEQCWDSCESAALDNDDPRRPWLMNAWVFLGETGVNSSGMWSVTVSGVQSYDIGNVMLMVWDRNAELAIRAIGGWDYPELWDWESLSEIDVELQAGGRVSGRFATPSGGPLPTGRYALISSPSFGYDLDVNLGTGDFISPAIAPGEYGIAHGRHDGGYLTNNDAAQVMVTAGQTTQFAQPVQLLRTGGLTGTVSDNAGRTLDGVQIWGEISSQSPYHSMIGSPFEPNGATWFDATTDENGTYTAHHIVPGDWEVTFGVPSPNQYTAAAAGYAHSCALRADRTIDCWGSNYDGQADPPNGHYTHIAAGSGHSCAIAADQTIDCWGANYSGQTDAPNGHYTHIAAGSGHSCAIAADQTIDCWGGNDNGQTDAPAGHYTAITASDTLICAIKTDQTIDCWGDDYRGLTDVIGTHHTAIASSETHACAIRSNQTIDCWGDYAGGSSIAPDGQYTAIAVGLNHSCAIAADQTINCWGANHSGQTDAPDGQYTAITAGEDHTCAITTHQTIDCWGYTPFSAADLRDTQYTAIASVGDLACALTINQSSPCWERRSHFYLADSGDFTNTIEWSHACAINADRTIDCWGTNWAAPDVGPNTQYTAIAVGNNHSCAIAADQTINCWGWNMSGETDAPEGQYTAIAVGNDYSCAIAADQTINCWGSNWAAPDVGPSTQYTAIAIGRDHSCAIAADQTIDCWGANYNGQANAGPPAIVRATVSSGRTTTGVDYPISDDTDDDDTGDNASAQQCFAAHQFGAQPVDVAKTADGQTVLAQLNWGHHESIGCYLTLDQAALGVLQAAAAPMGFPAADPDAAQRCSAVHKFGAQPVDVAKTADGQTVLAQVRWGYHESIGCYLALDTAATAALRAAHT